jgi:hypothetical protein
MGGAFSLLFSIFLLFTAICYRKSPKSIIAEKKEYVKFFLDFFILYFAFDGIATLSLYRLFGNNRLLDDYLPLVVILALFPALFLFHLLYPFKEVKRNQHVSFFLFFASILMGCIGLFFILLDLSNM